MSAPYTKLDRPLDENAVLCRGCLVESGEMKNIYDWGMADDFFKLTLIQKERSETISELLCTACEDLLMTCKGFQKRCQNSDLLLRKLAKKKTKEITVIDDHEIPNDSSVACVVYDKKLIFMITAPHTDVRLYLSCPYCNETYLKQKDLLTHLGRSHQTDDQPFTIDLQYYCSEKTCTYHLNSGKVKFFRGRKYLNQHYIKVHMAKIYPCNQCSLKFATGTELNRHLKVCNTKFMCQACNVNYKSNEKLLVHLMRKHPELHKKYKEEKNSQKRRSETVTDPKKLKFDEKLTDYTCDSPKRSFATQTLAQEANIKNDVTLLSWNTAKNDFETKTDEISTQTVFEDLLSLKSQTSEDESSIFFSETVSLSDIQTQTFPLEFGLSRSDKETLTSETQSPDLSIKETQTCFCLFDSPKLNFRLFDSVSSSPSSVNLTSTETQTGELRTKCKTDVLLNCNSAETQTSFEEGLKNSL